MTDWFRLREHKMDLRTECMGGLTTFFTALYIIFVTTSIDQRRRVLDTR